MSTTTSQQQQQQPPTNEKRSLSETAHQMTSSESKQTLSSQFIDESDLVLNDLNAIIESHSANNFGSTNGHKSSFKKKAESFRKLVQADSIPKQAIDVKMVKMTQLNKSQSVDMPPEVDLRSNEVVRSERLVPHPQSSSTLNLANQTSHKLKSKSYFVNTSNISRKQNSGSQQLGPTTSHGAHPSTIFLSHMPPVCFNSSSIVASSGNATISGLKTKKLTNLNINVLPQSLAPATCLINTAKKKRASLFNLFSFSKSATSNSPSNQTNSVSIANSECNLSEDPATPTAKLNKSLFNLKASSASTKCISTSIDREKSRQHDVQLSLNAHNPSSTVSLVHHSTTPSPDRWHTNLKQLLTKKVSKKEKKASQSSTSGNKLITPKSNDDDLLLAEFDSSPCLSSFKLTTCDAENKTSRMSEKVDDANESTSSSSSSSSVSVSPIGSSRSISPPCMLNNNEQNSSKQSVNLSKTPSIRSRGFSIPLNASVCLNTTNFLNYQAPASTRLTSPRSPVDCHVRFLNYSLKQSMQPSHDDLTIANKSNHLCIHTDQCEADELIDDENIEFPIVNSFDLRKEVANSCLREVNLKLRYAQIKHIDELPADESQPIKSDRSANETSNESESKFSQFHDALRRSQAEQRQQVVHEEVEKNLEQSDFSQIVASLDEQNKKSQENEERDKQASLQSTSSISSLIANPQSQLEQHNHTNNQCSSSISGSIIDLKAKQNSLKRIMANQQTQQQQQLKPELEPQQQQQQALNSYSTNDKTLLSQAIQHKEIDELKKQQANQQLNANGKKKRFQQFQTRSLINLNGKAESSTHNVNTNASFDTQCESIEAENIVENKSSSQQQQQQQQQQGSRKPSLVKLLSSFEQHKEESIDELQLSLIYTDLAETRLHSEMVHLRKGVKLRELLKPVMNAHQMDVDNYDFYVQNEKAHETASLLFAASTSNNENSKENTSLVDLNCNSEQLAGLELYIKQKLNDSVSVNSSSNAAQMPSFSLKSRKTSLQMQPASQETTSTSNWPYIFSTKSNGKDKLSNKQKRNSCIAVMNDSGSCTINGSTIPITTTNSIYVTNNNNNNNTNNNQATSMRDSVNSFNSFLSNSNINSGLNLSQVANSSISSSPSDRSNSRANRKFRHISNIFANNANTNNSTNGNQNKELVKFGEFLNNYLKELPKLPEEFNLNEYDPMLLEIEAEWHKFVGEQFAKSLPTKVAKQQMAIWELIVTECSHIKTTKVIIDVFLSCLVNLKMNEWTWDLFRDIDTRTLFSNIIDVFNCNFTFWKTYLHPILSCLKANGPNDVIIDTDDLLNGFLDFENLFAPYEQFILEKNNSVEYFKQKLSENEHFSKFITWAENHPLVGRLKIADFMMIPVQRLTKYPLLIENINQFTDDEAKRERISSVVKKVNALPNSINVKLNYILQFNDISESIEKYEGIVGPTDEINELLGAYKKVDIKSPLPNCSPKSVRELIHQGPLKLKETSKSHDVHCFLFTDMLLITQQKKTKKYRIIKPPISTHRMVVKELQQTDKAFVVLSVNDYDVPESVAMFVSNQTKKWLEFLDMAKKKYQFEMDKYKTSCEETTNKLKQQICAMQAANELSKNVEMLKLERQETLSRRTSERDESINDEQDTSNQSSQGVVESESGEHLSSSCLKENSNNETTNESESTCQSQHTSMKKYQKQSDNTSGYATRVIDRRIERQRRNMTDPTTHHANNPIDERHSLLLKRNSLNDKSTNRHQPTSESTSGTDANQVKLVNLCGDSTSTIMSTDSGVSATSGENHLIFVDEQSSNQAPSVKLINLINNMRPTTQVDTEPSESNLDLDLESSEDHVLNDAAYIDLNAAVDTCQTRSLIKRNNKVIKPKHHMFTSPYATFLQNQSQSQQSTGGPQAQAVTFDYINAKFLQHPAHFDLNNNDLTCKYLDYVNKQADELINSNETQKLFMRNDSAYQPMDQGSCKSKVQQQQAQPTQTAVRILKPHTMNNLHGESKSKKPLIKIKSATVINESVRVKPSEFIISANEDTAETFDSTIESAQLSMDHKLRSMSSAFGNNHGGSPDVSSSSSNNTSCASSSSNGMNLDRMILVKLIHATMDATEV